jgi:AcrR family transcriptional regulator
MNSRESLVGKVFFPSCENVRSGEVAEQAGVNRGAIYQYFGSKQGLLKAALGQATWHRAPIFHELRYLPFARRRRLVFEEALKNQAYLRVEALLALDGNEDVHPFPWLEQTLGDLSRDKSNGELPQDADALAMHVITAATYLGYAVFREAFARDTGIDPSELDTRTAAAFGALLDDWAGRQPRTDT